MSLYRFGRFGTLLRDDHPFALYSGSKRLSPPPTPVWWWPMNWLAGFVMLPWIAMDVVRNLRRKEPRP